MTDIAPVLLLDIGNSQVKWLLVGSDGELERGTLTMEALDTLRGIQPDPSAVLCSCVAGVEHEDRVRRVWSDLAHTPWFAVSATALGGLSNSYAQPERMGVDRWLAMLGAWRRNQERLCVIDAGSALTIDFVSPIGEHEGGFIIPGRALMKRALLSDTDRVRFGDLDTQRISPGTSTAEAVEHGLLVAQCGAIRLALEEAEREQSIGTVYLCGGDAENLVEHLPACLLAPDLVFEGLAYQAVLEGVVTPEQEPRWV